MTYNEVINLCVKKFNEVFDTSYNVQYDSKDNILGSNPNFKVSEKTAGLYDKKSHRIYIDCIKRVIAQRHEKDRKIAEIKPESIVEELRRYTQITAEPSQTTIPMSDKEYYEMLKEFCKTIESGEYPR